MSPDEAIFIHPAAPLLPQHEHVAATLLGAFQRPARANQPLPQKLDLWVCLQGGQQLVLKALRHVFS
ncbi:hypothetical protein T05_12771 [Trichinella murrelli]|uniref:Uncharacterized protein n=1 Tax=Trichinella murrelli TaxID=144512 RepID=A0A0V0UB63_9BILA|nr:hypothetical protein T05_12771 [Trichinella murrelli]